MSWEKSKYEQKQRLAKDDGIEQSSLIVRIGCGLLFLVLLGLLFSQTNQDKEEQAFRFDASSDPHFSHFTADFIYNQGKLFKRTSSTLEAKKPEEELEKELEAAQAASPTPAPDPALINRLDISLPLADTPNSTSVSSLGPSRYLLGSEVRRFETPKTKNGFSYLELAVNGQTRYAILEQEAVLVLAKNYGQVLDGNLEVWVTQLPDATEEERIKVSPEEVQITNKQDLSQAIYTIRSKRMLKPGEQLWIRVNL